MKRMNPAFCQTEVLLVVPNGFLDPSVCQVNLKVNNKIVGLVDQVRTV